MSMYRTVDVTPEIISDRNVTITIADNVVSTTASVQKIIDVDAVVDNSLVIPNADLTCSLIGVDANCYTNIMTHSGDAEYYRGDYVVKPKMHNSTTLNTNGKIMSRDVTVLEIPYFETSNLSGGTTVYIATEDY